MTLQTRLASLVCLGPVRCFRVLQSPLPPPKRLPGCGSGSGLAPDGAGGEELLPVLILCPVSEPQLGLWMERTVRSCCPCPSSLLCLSPSAATAPPADRDGFRPPRSHPRS